MNTVKYRTKDKDERQIFHYCKYQISRRDEDRPRKTYHQYHLDAPQSYRYQADSKGAIKVAKDSTPLFENMIAQLEPYLKKVKFVPQEVKS